MWFIEYIIIAKCWTVYVEYFNNKDDKVLKVLCLVYNFTFVLLQVVGAYLAFIVQAEIEKGNNINMYPSQTMTSIMSGN